MRVLIVGCDGGGQHIASLLAKEGHRVGVIDRDPARLEALTSEDNVEGFLTCEPLMDNLRQAGVSNADVFMALTADDSHNIMAAQVAQHMFHVPRVICRIDDIHRQQVYQELGLIVISPTMALVKAVQETLSEEVTPPPLEG